MYKRPNDQYKISRAREMREELNKKIICNKSTVISYRKIDFGGGPHAGTLSHICGIEKGHLGKCKCANCGCEFMSIG